MDTLRLSKEALEERFTDEQWRRNFYEAHHLMRFLSQCILCDDYKIPDGLSSLIPLSDFGNDVFNKLVRKNEVNAKTARLLCLLTLVHREPLIDFSTIDVDAVRKFIDAQLREGKILLPFVLGRTLYDRFATLFEEPRSSLPHGETLKLLADTPIGVFQSGPFLSGPFGLLRVDEQRWFAPQRSVPLFHCAELTCRSVHECRLSSDTTSQINKDAGTMSIVLESYGDDESDWGEFLDLIGGDTGIEFDDETNEPIFLALGDLFADDELRALLSDLLDTTGGELRKRINHLGLVGRASDIVQEMPRADLIQLILLSTSATIIKRIDHLITTPTGTLDRSEPVLKVGTDETRRLMTNRNMCFGIYNIYPEVSKLGLRFKSDLYDLGPLRLKRLVQSLYDISDTNDEAELNWQLRSIDGDDLHERLEQYVRSANPRDVVQQLVLSRSTNQEAAAERLGVAYADLQDDSLFADTLLWKLGFYATQPHDPTAEFWKHFEQFKRYAETAGIGSRIDNVDLQSKAVLCFVQLEGVLDQALAFSTWALTVDHLESGERAFSYASWYERSRSFERLNQFEQQRRVPRDEPIALSEGNTLGQLIPSFGTLRDLLASYIETAPSHLRPEADYPYYTRHTDLKQFPFKNRVPFLDLLSKSQERVLSSLEDVRKALEGAEVASVRNGFGHYRAALPEIGRVQRAVSAMETAVRRLEADGLIPVPFVSQGSSTDDWGRRVFRLRSLAGRELVFARPSSFDWSQLPSLRGVQYVVPAAVFAQPNEMLRFRIVDDTAYANFWSDYPQRRRRRGSLGSAAPAERFAGQ